jgi:hypothetical protein
LIVNQPTAVHWKKKLFKESNLKKNGVIILMFCKVEHGNFFVRFFPCFSAIFLPTIDRLCKVEI